MQTYIRYDEIFIWLNIIYAYEESFIYILYRSNLTRNHIVWKLEYSNYSPQNSKHILNLFVNYSLNSAMLEALALAKV